MLLVLEGDDEAVFTTIAAFIELARANGVDVCESWMPSDDEERSH